MGFYRNVTDLDNLLVEPDVPRPKWSLKRRLRWLRQRNPRYTRGRGAARRSRYEHQLDSALELLRACGTPEAMATLQNRRRVAPHGLLHERLGGRAPAIHAYRLKIERAMAWCLAHHPRTGWALPQSGPRRKRDRAATEYYLPRRSWEMFFAWRRVVRFIARMLDTLKRWWEVLIPVLRSVSPRPKAEERRSETERREHGAGTRYRDQRTLSAGDVLARVMPHPAM